MQLSRMLDGTLLGRGQVVVFVSILDILIFCGSMELWSLYGGFVIPYSHKKTRKKLEKTSMSSMDEK